MWYVQAYVCVQVCRTCMRTNEYLCICTVCMCAYYMHVCVCQVCLTHTHIYRPHVYMYAHVHARNNGFILSMHVLHSEACLYVSLVSIPVIKLHYYCYLNTHHKLIHKALLEYGKISEASLHEGLIKSAAVID